MDLPARIVGGTADHVHILYSASRVDTIAESVQAVKQNSSKWVKTKHAALRPFAWQGGYGVFSVSHSNLRRVADYIANQEAHHKKETFQSEYRKFLRRHEIEFDERYVWD
jgi:REP element-mobilizing transposase RayT